MIWHAIYFAVGALVGGTLVALLTLHDGEGRRR